MKMGPPARYPPAGPPPRTSAPESGLHGCPGSLAADYGENGSSHCCMCAEIVLPSGHSTEL